MERRVLAVKFVMIVLVLLLVYLFYPFRDLYVKEDPFATTYSRVAPGFWSEESCQEAADAQQASDYYCRKGTAFARMFHSASDFGQGHGIQE